MSDIRTAERTYREVRKAARRRTVFTLQWEFNRVSRMAHRSSDAVLLARLAALRDELIYRRQEVGAL